jgi:hypothetical protein
MYSSALFWYKDISLHCPNVQRMDPHVFFCFFVGGGGVASRSDNVVMTPDCSTLPVLTSLWEIQANYANTGSAIGAGAGHSVTSTIT